VTDYRVVITPTGKSLFDYHVPGTPVQGRSGQPLLDACRQLKQMGAPLRAKAALYHSDVPGSWTVRCTIEKGAKLDVDDGRFVPHRPEKRNA